MKRNYCVFFLLIFYSSIAFGQSYFRKGYYIKWNQDTVHGLIDYRTETKNTRNCVYKKDENAKTEKLAPEDIFAYRFVDGKYYISRKIDIGNGEEQVFLEFLLNGITNLYFYRDLDNYIYFIESKKGELVEIKKETEVRVIDGREFLVETNKHIGVLRAVFGDCMEIQPKLNTTELTHKSLIKISKDYHNYVCTDGQECIIYEKKVRLIKIQFAPIAGVSTYNLNFDKGFYSNFSYNPSTNPTFGIQVNVFSPFLNEKISFQVEAHYSSFDFYGIYNNYYELFIKNSILQPSFAVKYNYPKGKVRPTIAGGVVYSKLLNPQIDGLVQNIPEQPANEVSLSPDDLIMSQDLSGAFVQLGCNYFVKNLEIFSNLKYTYCKGDEEATTPGIQVSFVQTILKSINFSVGFYF